MPLAFAKATAFFATSVRLKYNAGEEGTANNSMTVEVEIKGRSE